MLQTDHFYAAELEGKNNREISKKIRDLRQQIEELKDIAENPDYDPKETDGVDARIRLPYAQSCFDRAVQALEENGGSYKPSKAELSAMEFDAAIPRIEKITFSMGGFLGGFEIRTVALGEKQLTLTVEHYPAPEDVSPQTHSMRIEDFIHGLYAVRMGEWRHHYDAADYGITISDGTSWDISVEYRDGSAPERFTGNNAYPFSFEAFCTLMGKK